MSAKEEIEQIVQDTGKYLYEVISGKTGGHWDKIGACNSKYGYAWKPCGIGDYQICFTGFRASNPFSAEYEKDKDAGWHTACSQVLIGNRFNNTYYYKNIDIDERDPRWAQPFKEWFEPLLHAAEDWCKEQILDQPNRFGG